jgi:hypothetical protein
LGELFAGEELAEDVVPDVADVLVAVPVLEELVSVPFLQRFRYQVWISDSPLVPVQALSHTPVVPV